jgi:hypothetical protein
MVASTPLSLRGENEVSDAAIHYAFEESKALFDSQWNSKDYANKITGKNIIQHTQMPITTQSIVLTKSEKRNI